MYDEDCAGTQHFFEVEYPDPTDLCQCGEYYWKDIIKLAEDQEEAKILTAMAEAKSKLVH